MQELHDAWPPKRLGWGGLWRRPRNDAKVVDEGKVCGGADKVPGKGRARGGVLAAVREVADVVCAVCAEHAEHRGGRQEGQDGPPRLQRAA